MKIGAFQPSLIRRNMDKDEIIRAHLVALEPECRWCFAVDMVRVKGEEINEYHFPDALLLHLRCPRCGGEFTYYSEGWDERYIRRVLSKVRPELASISADDKRFEEIVNRVFPELDDC